MESSRQSTARNMTRAEGHGGGLNIVFLVVGRAELTERKSEKATITNCLEPCFVPALVSISVSGPVACQPTDLVVLGLGVLITVLSVPLADSVAWNKTHKSF